MEINLTIVRHGQTDGNVKDLGHARTNDPLNSHGKLQAKLAGQRLKDETFDQVYSSTSDRAHQTATIMLQENMTPHKEVILTNALMERHYGVLEGVPREQIRQAMRESGKGLLEFNPEGGETIEEMDERVWGFLQNIFDSARKNDQRKTLSLLLVTHGGWIFQVYKLFNGTVTDLEDCLKMVKPININTGITKLTLLIDRDTGKVLSGKCDLNHSTDHLTSQ